MARALYSSQGENGQNAARQAKPGRKKTLVDQKEDYSVAMWGRCDQFQLGNGERIDRQLPVTMMFTKVQITSVACGSKHTIVLLGPSHAPRVFAWGEAQHGQLGVAKNASMHAMSPIEVEALAPTSTFMVRKVGAGGNGSFALTSRQELLLWGDNSNEQLGLGSSLRGVDRVFSPKPLSPNWDTVDMQWRTLYITKAVLARKFGLAVDKYGRVFAWGENIHGQLGVGDRSPRNTPVMVEGLQQVRQIAVGLQHSAAIDSRHHLYTWGDCADGRLGHGVLHTEVRSVKNNVINRSRKRVESLLEPKCVDFFRSGKDVSLVACGDRFTVAVDGRGDAWTWGSGIYGQLGRGANHLSSELPSRVEWAQLRRTNQGHDFPTKVLRISEDEDGRKDCNGVHDSSSSVGPCSPSSALPFDRQSSLRQQSLDESAKQSTQEETSMASISKSSHEVPIFQTIQAGPYHCCALTDDGRLFTWGKGKFGVLGQNTEDNHYEPVQVVTEPGLPVQRFATGEYHSLAIVEADRLDMVDKGYRFRAIPNADDQVFIVEQSDIRQEDLKARFRTDENSPVERYNKEGRSAKGQFSNLIEVTEDGKFVLDKGLGKREEVGQDAIEPARALSVKEATRDIVVDREGIIASAEKFLGSEGWDLLDGHIPEWPNELCGNLDPRLEQATSAEIKSQWGQYTHVPSKRMFDEDETPKGRATTSPPESPSLATANKSGFTSFKTAMSVEDKRIFDEFHKNEIRRNRHCIIDAHTRRRYAKDDPDSTNLHNNRTFSQAERFATSDKGKRKDELGPGEYGVHDNHPEWAKPEPCLVVKPAGVGITITVKEHHVGKRISILTPSDPFKSGQYELAVKEVLKGGSVDESGKELSQNDVILKVDGEPVTDLHQCRRKLMGEPGTRVTILYRHKDPKSGENMKLKHTFVRKYIGKNRDRTAEAALTEVHPVPGRYMGVGLEAPRFDDRDVLTEEQETEVLKMFEQLQDDLAAPNRDEMFQGSPFILPKDPGIKRVTDRMHQAFPEWSAELSRPTAILRVLKKHGKLQQTYSDVRDNPHVAPGSYSPKRTAAHNWTLDGKIAQPTVTYASAAGPKMMALPEKKEEAEPKHEDLQQEAAQIVIGRPLAPGEFDRLPAWKQRKMKDIMAAMDKRDDTGPGPAQYAIDYQKIGHQLKGATIAKKHDSKGASTQETPGPNHYNVVRDGLELPGDFKDKKGNVVVYRDIVGPVKDHADETPDFCIKPGSFSSACHPIRKTAFTNAPSVSIATREAWEKLGNHETQQEYHIETKQWREAVPGPGSYATPKPHSSRAVRMHGREAIEKENARKSGAYDPHSKSYVNSVPGPAAYMPLVLKNGSSLEHGKDGPNVIVGIRLDKKKEEFETPGPGCYTVPSCFDETDFNLSKGTKGGPHNHGWMGERPPPPKRSTAESWPGPGEYDTRGYDAIGTDLVSIGAATRAMYGMTATEAIRPDKKKQAEETQVRPVLNYSAMNKAIEGLKHRLGEIFLTVYDAFAYFDVDGDWGISECEFRRMLKELKIEIDDANLGLIVRRMDVVSDGSIDPKEFIQALRWHPSMYKKFADEEKAMRQAASARPMILKNAMLKVAELQVEKQMLKERQKKRSSQSPSKVVTNLIRPHRPLTARADMRRGFSFTARDTHIGRAWGDTPGPAHYAPRAPGDLALKVGMGKSPELGVQVNDALCWAGSWMTGTAAPITGRNVSGKNKAADRAGPVKSVPIFAESRPGNITPRERDSPKKKLIVEH